MAYLLQHQSTSIAQLPELMYVSKEVLRLTTAGRWSASDVILKPLIATCCSADAAAQLHAVQLALLCILLPSLLAFLCGAASQPAAASTGYTT